MVTERLFHSPQKGTLQRLPVLRANVVRDWDDVGIRSARRVAACA